MSRARILLADDHALVVGAFQRLLEPDYDIVGVAEDGEAVLVQAQKLRPNVILLDVQMPKLSGIDAAEKLRSKLPRTRIIFLTSSEDPVLAADVIAAGASGFLLKSSAVRELPLAIEAALSGKTYVTPSIAGEMLAAPSGDPQAARGGADDEGDRRPARHRHEHRGAHRRMTW